MTPEYLSEGLERQQTLALKNIFGVLKSAKKMREEAGLETVWLRRESAVLKFKQKTSKNPRFLGWFPKRTERSVRRQCPFQEKIPRTDRYKNAPLNYMKKALNNLAERDHL